MRGSPPRSQRWDDDGGSCDTRLEMHIRVSAIVIALAAGVCAVGAQQSAPTDLDALMARAIAHRDENWKKLPQYLLDEKEKFEIRTPANTVFLGDEREYAWFIRDGFFVRSPVRANGVTIAEDERRKYEQEWLRRERNRERRARAEGQQRTDALPDVVDAGSLASQTREPRFISAGYLLEFTFEP